jgi:hypothetical protein
MNQPPKPPGRPPIDGVPAVGHIHLRVTMERKNRYVRAARAKQTGLSEWITNTCDAASKPPGTNEN